MHVDLVSTGLVGDESQPTSIGREHRTHFPEVGIGKERPSPPLSFERKDRDVILDVVSGKLDRHRLAVR